MIKREKIIIKPENLVFTTDIGILRFSEIDQYNPITTPKKVQITKEVEQFLEAKYSDRRNIEATNMDNLSTWLTGFCKKNPKLLSELGIKDIYYLSPKQAILLTSQIVQKRLQYSYLQIAVEEKYTPESNLHRYSFGYLGTPPSTEYIVDKTIITKLSKEQQKEIITNPRIAYQRYTVGLDNAPIDQLLERDRQGVCRNYAQVTKAIFDIFKNLQNSKTSQLVNTYCKQFGSMDNDLDQDNAAERRIIKNHRWNTFYTVLPNGELDEVIMDVNHTDDTGEKSYSRNRFLFDLIELVDKKLMTKEQQIIQLEYFIERIDTKKPEYRAVCEYLGDYYFSIGNKKLGIQWYMKNPSKKSGKK